MTVYTWAWIFWLALFAVIEGAAIIDRDRGDTLSEHVWAWFGVRGKPKGYKARRFVLLAFLAWLVVHLITGGYV